MITIESTENFTGVTIKGGPDDLRELVDALHYIVVDEDDLTHRAFINISTRVLGLCYEIRHSAMGMREIELDAHGIPCDLSEKNLYCSCKILYPEMIFNMLALFELIELKTRDIDMDNMVVWHPEIAVIRNFQAAFNSCVRKTMSSSQYFDWFGIINGDYVNIKEINDHFIDLNNINYLKMAKDDRLDGLIEITQKITEFRYDSEHRKIVHRVIERAKELDSSETVILLDGFDYPKEIKW